MDGPSGSTSVLGRPGGPVTEIDSAIRRWHATFVTAGGTSEHGGEFPPHSDQCLGCGPDNPHGHRLKVTRHGGLLRAAHTFDGRHVGAPGIAHGGAVAAVLDDLCGLVPYVVGEMAVTRRLTVDYHAPAQIGSPLFLAAWLADRNGRKLVVRAEGRDHKDALVFSAEGLFLCVDTDHFRHANIPEETCAPVISSEST